MRMKQYLPDIIYTDSNGHEYCVLVCVTMNISHVVVNCLFQMTIEYSYSIN